MISPYLKNVVTYPKSRDPKSQRRVDQVAYQVSGKKMGNVPAKLCGVFRQLKSDRNISRIYCHIAMPLLRDLAEDL